MATRIWCDEHGAYDHTPAEAQVTREHRMAVATGSNGNPIWPVYLVVEPAAECSRARKVRSGYISDHYCGDVVVGVHEWLVDANEARTEGQRVHERRGTVAYGVHRK